jgi:hypothetical protein
VQNPSDKDSQKEINRKLPKSGRMIQDPRPVDAKYYAETTEVNEWRKKQPESAQQYAAKRSH